METEETPIPPKKANKKNKALALEGSWLYKMFHDYKLTAQQKKEILLSFKVNS